MTIEYPRAIPLTKIASVQFEAEPQEANSGEAGGRFVSTMIGPSLWRAAFGTQCSNEVDFSIWRAWLDSLDGSGKEFFGYDVRRPMPWAYRRTGFGELVRAVSLTAFNGTSSSWSVDSARDEITIGAASGQQLPVGFQFTIGDYIGLEWDDSGYKGRSLHRALTSYNADASGVAIVTVRPHISIGVPDTATVNLIKPACRMAITKRDRNAEGKDRRIAFEAVQNLEFPAP